MLRPKRCRSRALIVTSGVSFHCSSTRLSESPGSSADAASLPGLELVPAVLPLRALSLENIRSPKFLGEPCMNMPRSSTPALSNAIGFLRPPCCLPLGVTASADGRHPLFRGSITRPVHSLCTLHVTGRPVPAQHSLPAGHHPLLDRIPTCRLSLKGFRLCSHYLIVFPLSEASWRTTPEGCRRAPVRDPCRGRNRDAPHSSGGAPSALATG